MLLDTTINRPPVWHLMNRLKRFRDRNRISPVKIILVCSGLQELQMHFSLSLFFLFFYENKAIDSINAFYNQVIKICLRFTFNELWPIDENMYSWLTEVFLGYTVNHYQLTKVTYSFGNLFSAAPIYIHIMLIKSVNLSMKLNIFI